MVKVFLFLGAFFQIKAAVFSDPEITQIENKIGVRFRDTSLLESSFTPSSPRFRRLELLGDAELYRCVTRYYLGSIDKPETVQAVHDKRERVKNNVHLARVFKTLDLEEYLKKTDPNYEALALVNGNKETLCANVIEALIGAMIYDGEALAKESAKEFILNQVIHLADPLASAAKRTMQGFPLEVSDKNKDTGATAAKKSKKAPVKNARQQVADLRIKKLKYIFSNKDQEAQLFVGSEKVCVLTYKNSAKKNKRLSKTLREQLAQKYLGLPPSTRAHHERFSTYSKTTKSPNDTRSEVANLYRGTPYTYKKSANGYDLCLIKKTGKKGKKNTKVLFSSKKSSKNEARLDLAYQALIHYKTHKTIKK